MFKGCQTNENKMNDLCEVKDAINKLIKIV